MCARNHFKYIFKRISALSFKFQMGSNLFQFVHWHALPAQHSSWKRLNLNKNLHPTIHLSVDLMKSDRIKELKLNHFCHIDLDLQEFNFSWRSKLIPASNGSQCTLRAKRRNIFNETLTIGNTSKIKHVTLFLGIQQCNGKCEGG